MKAHALGEVDSVLVTGTQDVGAALPLARACLVEDRGWTTDEADEWLSGRLGRATSGVIVPASQDDRDWLGYTWWWREGDGGGRVKAVVWDAISRGRVNGEPS